MAGAESNPWLKHESSAARGNRRGFSLSSALDPDKKTQLLYEIKHLASALDPDKRAQLQNMIKHLETHDTTKLIRAVARRLIRLEFHVLGSKSYLDIY